MKTAELPGAGCAMFVAGIETKTLSQTLHELVEFGSFLANNGDPKGWAELIDAANLSRAKLRSLTIMLCELVWLKEMPYADYLKTDHWQMVADYTKQAANGRCALDARHPADHVHHRTYERRGREHAEDVIALCRDCHSKFHGKH